MNVCLGHVAGTFDEQQYGVQLREQGKPDTSLSDSSVYARWTPSDVAPVPEPASLTLPVTEIWRVLKPGGRVQIADIVLGVELPEDARQDIDLWTG
jgi:arsenite methyltransferase